jgi:hypothetical protein
MVMPKSSAKMPMLGKGQAEARFRELVDELKLLTVAFPHLRESFDADELPVAFIVRRDGNRAKARAERRQRTEKTRR